MRWDSSPSLTVHVLCCYMLCVMCYVLRHRRTHAMRSRFGSPILSFSDAPTRIELSVQISILTANLPANSPLLQNYTTTLLLSLVLSFLTSPFLTPWVSGLPICSYSLLSFDFNFILIKPTTIAIINKWGLFSLLGACQRKYFYKESFHLEGWSNLIFKNTEKPFIHQKNKMFHFIDSIFSTCWDNYYVRKSFV